MSLDPERLAIALREAAQALIRQDPVRDLEQTVGELVRTAVATVPGATGGGISRVDRGAVWSSHATEAGIGKLDAIQTEIGEGPCITAAEDPPESGLIHADDLRGRRDTDRWPRFAPQAADLGFRSLLGIGLWTGHHRYAALNLYAPEPGAFDQDARLVAALFGAQAATLLYGAESASGMNQALASRDAIGQAKGILMERFGLGPDSAFRQLVKASQDTNMKLVAVAEWLTEEAAQRERTAAGPVGPAVDDDDTGPSDATA